MVIKCELCNKEFKSLRNFNKHKTRKYPCNKQFKCDKCNAVFRDNYVLNRHLRRKTSCEPIQGNPLEPIPNSLTCRFCYKPFKHKSSLKRHFWTCKIKNGGMPILFKKINELQEENKELRSNHGNNITNINIHNGDNYNNLTNIHNEIKLMNFGDLKIDDVVNQLMEESEDKLRLIFQKTIDKDKPIRDQWGKQLGEVVKTVYRNPQYPRLQNVFTLNAPGHIGNWEDPESIKSILWFRNKWTEAEWTKVRGYLIDQIHRYLPSFRGDMLKLKSKIRKARDSLDPDKKIKEEKVEPKLVNDFFNIYEDHRCDLDFTWIYIATALDIEKLLDMNEINRLLAADS